MQLLAQKSKEASKKIMSLPHTTRRNILTDLAQNILKSESIIIEANQKDLAAAEAQGLNPAMLDRLKLDSKRIQAMADGVQTDLSSRGSRQRLFSRVHG